jgi:hypothetical protein
MQQCRRALYRGSYAKCPLQSTPDPTSPLRNPRPIGSHGQPAFQPAPLHRGLCGLSSSLPEFISNWMLIRTSGPSLLNERRRKGASRPFILYLCSIQSDRYCEQFAPIFRRLVVKQPNLSRISRTLGQKIATLPEPRADLVKEPRVASLHSDSCCADRPIPRGIAILIEILAREADGGEGGIAKRGDSSQDAPHFYTTAPTKSATTSAQARPKTREGRSIKNGRRYKDQILPTARPAPDGFSLTKSDRYKDQIGFVGSGGRI